MPPLALNELFTLILAILAILLGIAMNARWTALRASNIPPAVLGGLVFACIATALAIGPALQRAAARMPVPSKVSR